VNSVTVPILHLPHANDLNLPKYATDGAAGLDLVAALESQLELNPGGRALIPTGISLALPRAKARSCGAEQSWDNRFRLSR
jgi:dUTP pyrophosphatase